MRNKPRFESTNRNATQLYCVRMKFDNFPQAPIEFDLTVGGDFIVAFDGILSKIRKTLLNICDKCHQEMANTKVNDQKCDKNFQNAKEK